MGKELKIVAPDGYEIDRENSTLERIIFKKKPIALPKSWEEFCAFNPIKIGESFIAKNSRISCDVSVGRRFASLDRNLLPDPDAAQQHLALMQLHQLRDCYRQGWKPEWSSTCADRQVKYCIMLCDGKIDIATTRDTTFFLAFQDMTTRDLFLANFKDLIEQAGDLI